MNNHLENFVQQNKEAFDMHEPSPEVWKAIHSKSVKSKVRSLQWVKYAAALIIFTVGFILGTNFNKQGTNGSLAKSNKQKIEEQSELIENEYYYLTKINDRMHELEPFFASDPQLKHDIEIDFEELDSFCKNLKEDLDDEINNQHVIEAMIQSYQMKLEILETLLEQLKQLNHEEIKYDV